MSSGGASAAGSQQNSVDRVTPGARAAESDGCHISRETAVGHRPLELRVIIFKLAQPPQ
jgi:hypothetical protein